MGSPQISISSIDNEISCYQDILSPLPRSHPLRPRYVQALAVAYFKRYTLSSQMDDLDKTILHYTEAIFLPLPFPSDGHCRNIFQLLFSLTDALIHRARQSKEPEDVKCCITYLRYLQDLPLKTYGVPHSPVLSSLVEALAIHAESESDVVTVMRDFEEMANLCGELLVYIQKDCRTYPGTPLDLTRWSRRQEPITRVIESLREANRRLPDFHAISIALAWSLLIRFTVTCLVGDYEEAAAILDKTMASHAPSDSPTSYQLPSASILIPFILYSYTSVYGDPEDSEEAIRRLRIALDMTSPDHPLRPIISTTLACLQQRRCNEFGTTGRLEDVLPSNSDAFDLPTGSPSLAKSIVVKSPPITTEAGQHVEVLSADDAITDMADTEEAIKYFRTLLASSHPSGLIFPFSAVGLTIFLLRAFERTDKIEYLNEAISALRDILEMRNRSELRLIASLQLISCLSTRLRLLDHAEDLDELMQLFPTVVDRPRVRVPERFKLSCEWASLARYYDHCATSTAYESAISLMQDSLTFAPTLEVQHFRLVAMRDSYEKLPLVYASYQVHTGQLEQAIVTLERGRALLWSEMRGLRTSIDQLGEADPHLAQKFVAVNRELEMLTMSVLPGGSGETYNVEVDDHEGMDPFGRLVVQHRQLLEEREKLISQIQSLSGFESFLKAPSFDTLRSAASHGPVIIINHCEWRSDILILRRDSPPSLITTAFDFYDRANSLKDRLLDARKEGLDSKQYTDTLSSVLKELYDLVGRPVIQRLCELNVPEQSRVWLCPTSVFCSLPLHAMGPIPSDDGAKQYFLDMYIPSYTPTLSSLIESHKGGAETFETPSILLVGQPDNSMPEAFKEVQVVQAIGPRVTSLISARATPSTVLERLRDHQFTHFLYRGMRLTLLDIVRSRLPNAEFAFLSACHTAELTDESLADEGLHLAAAMQYCGFRSAVGTMWAMADTDGRDVGGNFYKSVFSGRREGIPHYARTAEALRDAVKRLRRKRKVTLERWVNFVHYGA
ncbi:hypothetical protein BJV78DRAFT_1358864 [Lactifluus subvellereus]|nr:hypothetical protein BJV78DRAFT_1358864 [Lactifluus subvellereus]